MIQTILDYLKLKRHQKRFSIQKIKDYQLKEIQKLLLYAQKNSSFYQERLQTYQINTLEDYHQIPTINKHIMMENFSNLNTCGLIKEDVEAYAILKEKNKDYLGYYKNQYVIGLSSGTSGNRGIYITPKSMTKRLPGVFLARSGLSPKDLPMRILFCLRVFSQGFNDINAPFIKLNYMSTMTPPEEIITTINQKNINILMAPPSLIRFLLPLKDEIKVPFNKIITYAEVLTKTDKEQFEKAFHSKVIEIYQASEGQIASACEKGSLHINEDLVYIELYDQDNHLITKPHITGHKMVLTNLINHAQPLIRYEMNDMIVLDDPCPCGSHFRTIEKILGRNDDLIYFYNSTGERKVLFPDLFSRWIITESDQVREFQVIQNEIGTLDITIDCEADEIKDKLKQRLIDELKALDLSGIIHVTVKKIELPQNQNKYIRLISKIKM